MKRMIALALLAVLVIGLAACGKQETVTMDLAGVYAQYADKLPVMMELDETERLDFMGLEADDCQQAIVAICGSGLGADEVWLIQAKDAAALERIQKLAENRMAAKAEETESYVPDQYLVVKEGKLVTRGLYFALLVSPEVESMEAIFKAA